MVDTSIINALSSTRNKDKQHDPNVNQTHKDNLWYLEMKAHTGVNSQTKLIHSIVVSPANDHNSQVLGNRLHCEETRAWCDSAYAGQQAVLQEMAPGARDFYPEERLQV